MASHGEALVAALLASGRYCVIYRPHPLTGISEDNVGLADILLRAMVRETAAVDPVADHRVDIDRDFAESAAASDLLFCDVSSVSVDYLPSGKPLIITELMDARVVPAETQLLRCVPRLTAEDALRVVEIVAEQLEIDPLRPDGP